MPSEPAGPTAHDESREPPARTSEEFHLFLALVGGSPLAASRGPWSVAKIDEVLFQRDAAFRVEDRLEGGVRRLVVHLPDQWLSHEHARMLRMGGRWILVDLQSSNGTFVNGACCERIELGDGDLIEVGRAFFLFRRTAPPARPDSEATLAVPPFATHLPDLEAQFAALRSVATSETPVLVRGESGTGKELVAQAVHDLSGRGGRFVAVNCAALAESLVQSELFGHVRGAFTGAIRDKKGLVRTAVDGTLFLDEIGDLGPVSQAALLRVLQEREVLPLGAERPIAVDFRLVAATHRDLDALIGAGTFRADLSARVRGFTVTLPPLRARREDFGLILAAILRRLAGDRAEQIVFEPAAARALLQHAWPLNIRELERIVQAALALATKNTIGLQHLPGLTEAGATPAPEPVNRTPSPPPLSDTERERMERLIALLREHNGNISRVAEAMPRNRKLIQKWIKRYGLNPADYKK